jgi:hypothetical protein
MLTEKQLNRINKLLSTRTFKYKGRIINDLPESMISDIDYKFKIDGYKKMTSVGEEYDYALLNVVITGLNDRFSQLLFTPEDNEQGKMIAKSFENRLYKFYSDLNLAMTNFLRIFDGDIRTTIDSLTFDMKKPENITESRMSRVDIRNIVKDVVTILKRGDAGYFYLPKDISRSENYEFKKPKFIYSVEFEIRLDDENRIKTYSINADYSSEDDVLEILIVFNPKLFSLDFIKQNFYQIIGELNEIVAHELEHAIQYNKGEHTYKYQPKDSFKYYTQPHEVKAQRAGFRRIAKLRKLPFNNVVRDWFEDHKEIHQMNDNEVDKVIQIIING